MITLHLHGQLAELFGKEITLNAETPREAVTALSYQDSRYRNILETQDWHIFVGEGNDITENELDLQVGSTQDVFLMPRIEGASGAFNFVVGAALTALGGMTSIFGGAGIPVMAMGIGMMVGGLIQMTTKMPGASDLSRDAKDDKASFLFSGPTNTATQGVAIPRGYGRVLTGSVVVSVALYAEELSNFASEEENPSISDLIVGIPWWKHSIN